VDLGGGVTVADGTILCLNAGSSSLKFAVYRRTPNPEGETTPLAAGAVERIGLSQSRLRVSTEGAGGTETEGEYKDHSGAVQAVLDLLERRGLPALDAVGHRLVHGGPTHTTPERLDARLMESLRELAPLAPLHLPGELSVIEAVSARFPALPQVVCFDTAFHHRMPEEARRLPLPRALWDAGIRRYGFHGLSYEYIVWRLGPAARGRTIIAHLGNGSSMAAVRDGLPVDTTMGLTPTGGFMMGTRSGDLDPGVLLYLLREKGYDSERLDRLVNDESGLLGVSGLSPDMKTLLERRGREPAAAQAVAMFCYQLKKHIGALTATLGGLDTLVFTGGIGERAAPVRWEACQGLDHFGLRLDAERNAAHADTISRRDSRCVVRVIPAQEDLMIARHVQKMLASA
jgi:acetate kinase